jgi:hypothetical protein
VAVAAVRAQTLASTRGDLQSLQIHALLGQNWQSFFAFGRHLLIGTEQVLDFQNQSVARA